MQTSTHQVAHGCLASAAGHAGGCVLQHRQRPPNDVCDGREGLGQGVQGLALLLILRRKLLWQFTPAWRVCACSMQPHDTQSRLHTTTRPHNPHRTTQNHTETHRKTPVVEHAGVAVLRLEQRSVLCLQSFTSRVKCGLDRRIDRVPERSRQWGGRCSTGVLLHGGVQRLQLWGVVSSACWGLQCPCDGFRRQVDMAKALGRCDVRTFLYANDIAKRCGVHTDSPFLLVFLTP